MYLLTFPELAILNVLPHALSAMVASTAGTKRVKKRMHSYCKKLV